MRKIKNVLILAGGESRRFWPLTDKSLFQFLGKPLILYQIEELKKYCENFTIVSHKDNALVFKRLVENREPKIQVIVQKEEYAGQAGAILSVKNHLAGETLIVNANDLLDYSILAKITSIPAPKNKIIFFGKKLNEYFPGGYFKFDEKDRLSQIIEKPEPDKRPSNIVKLVVDYFSDLNVLTKTIAEVKTKQNDHYEQAMTKLLASDYERDHFQYDGYWQSLKYPWHVLSMMKIIMSGIKKESIPGSCQVSKKAIVVGPVVFGENVKVGDFAKIVGPAYIGDNSIVGDYSLIRESQIGEDCLIGSLCEVARSSVGNRVMLHRNYIGDSVMDNESMMGAGAITANFRFDAASINSYIGENKVDTGLGKLGAIIGRASKVGVNSAIIPGVKIGKNCLVAPCEVVRDDIDDNTYLIRGEERVNLYP